MVSAAASFAAEPLPLNPEWPPSWASAYRRFEKFIETGNTHLPASNLQVQEDGSIETSAPSADVKNGQREVAVYKYGLGRSAYLQTKGENKYFLRILQPGMVYPVVLKSLTSLGYQYAYPFKWITTKEENLVGGKTQTVIKETNPPEDPESVWPNERLFHFLDFNVFPKITPYDLLETNNKVRPWMRLAVTNDGTVYRQKFEAALEKHLRWRIYRDGELIEKGPLTADTAIRRFFDRTGDYQVFVGLEGPSGFMPVSNQMNFPLFPDEQGGLCVYPKAEKPLGVPQFILATLAPDQINSLRGELVKDRPAFTYLTNAGFSGYDARNLEDRKLLDLWNAWCWELNQAQDNSFYLPNFLREPPANGVLPPEEPGGD